MKIGYHRNLNIKGQPRIPKKVLKAQRAKLLITEYHRLDDHGDGFQNTQGAGLGHYPAPEGEANGQGNGG